MWFPFSGHSTFLFPLSNQISVVVYFTKNYYYNKYLSLYYIRCIYIMINICVYIIFNAVTLKPHFMHE
jgi:hypothetical protein